MSDKPEKADLPSLGIPLPRFQTAVDALVKLRDDGKFLVFLGRRSYVKLIGDPKEYRLIFSKFADQEIEQEEANSALEEIRRYCSAWIGMQNAEALINFLENAVYDDDFKKYKSHKADLKKQLEEKIKLVSEKVFTTAMEERASRMRSATSACLEDVDIEVVQERRDNFSFSSPPVKEPYLRLRVRYSDGLQQSGPLFFPFSYGMWGPWGGAAASASSFELECDESDIDLMILRLLEAKNSLLASDKATDGEAPF